MSSRKRYATLHEIIVRLATQVDADQRLRPAYDDLHHCELLVRDVCRYAYQIRRIVDAWTPHAATDKQRASVTRANDPEAECVHHRSFGTFEPVHRTTDGGGLLPHPAPLCRFCYDRLRTDGKLPTADRLQRLADGRGDRVRA